MLPEKVSWSCCWSFEVPVEELGERKKCSTSLYSPTTVGCIILEGSCRSSMASQNNPGTTMASNAT